MIRLKPKWGLRLLYFPSLRLVKFNSIVDAINVIITLYLYQSCAYKILFFDTTHET